MDLTPGQIVEKYEVERLLGRGGMASVWLVHHQKLGTKHALKLLSIQSRAVHERLMKEGQTQAHLRHPNVVAVTDVLDVGGNPALLLEYVEGTDLELWIPEHKPDAALAEQIFRGILDGVEAAHLQHVVHRDLKPANVLMAKTAAGAWLPKIADFGLVKLVAEATGGTSANATKAGMTMGSPGYMAPEQIRDASTVDPRADLFALGCILYELTCHTMAFDGPDLLALFEAITSAGYTDPRVHRPDLPAHLADTIRALLEPDPERRPQTVAEVRALLDGKRPAGALRPTNATWYDGASLPPRPQPTQAMAVGVGVGLVALVAVPLLAVAALAVLLWAWPDPAPGDDSLLPDVLTPAPVAPPSPTAGCDAAPEGALVGFVYQVNATPFNKGKRAGTSWTIPDAKPVLALDGDDVGDVVVCTLPKGTVIELQESARRSASRYYVPVHGGKYTVPAAEPPPAP